MFSYCPIHIQTRLTEISLNICFIFDCRCGVGLKSVTKQKSFSAKSQNQVQTLTVNKTFKSQSKHIILTESNAAFNILPGIQKKIK